MILYLLMFLIGGAITSLTGVYDSGYLKLSDPLQLIGIIAVIMSGIGLYGFIISLWFKILRIFYPRASRKRLWNITGNIFMIILIVICCFTGIGAVTLFFIKRPLTNLVPKDNDR
jgi:hypothetical protein